MTNTCKKIYIAIAGLLMAMTAQVNGTDCNQLQSCGQNNCGIQPNNCAICNSEVNFKGELLYWRPELGGLESAFGTTSITSTVASGIVSTTVTELDEDPKSKWNAGFRVGADVVFDCYDVELDWTHFNGSAHFNECDNYGHWKIRYDAIDLTLAERFCVTPCFYVKPFIGLRAVQIHQSLHSHLETLVTSLVGSNTVLSEMDDKENFWGVGPEVGIEADWYLGCNLSVYGCFDIVTYYGDIRGKNHDTDLFTTTESIANVKRNHCFNSIGTDAAIGFRWNKIWCCSCYETNLMVKLGAEQHRIYDFSNLGSDGTLSMDGGVFAVGVGFRY